MALLQTPTGENQWLLAKASLEMPLTILDIEHPALGRSYLQLFGSGRGSVHPSKTKQQQVILQNTN